MAANSTWFETTNEVLRLAMLPTIADVATFDGNDDLQEFQFGAKWYVRLCHKFMTLRLVKHFSARRIELPIDDGNHTYALDLGINGSCIKAESFFNITAGGVNNGPLKYYDYDQFLRDYPDPTLLASNKQTPTHWILLPLERSEDPANDGSNVQSSSAIQKVRFFPDPDDQYTIQYRAQILPYALEGGNDVILWPAEYEHCIWLQSWEFLERGLGEGKEGNIASYAQKAVQEVELIAGVPDDARRAIRTMGSMSGAKWPPGRYSGWISSPPD